MIFWQEVQKLEHRTLKTLDRCKPFDIVRITSRKVIVRPHETGKDRFIQRERLENSFKDLITSGNLSRSEIEDRHSPRNPAYIAAILAEMPGVRYSIRPIELHYSKGWINDDKDKKEEIKLPDTKQVERSAPSTSISPNLSISTIIQALIREIISTHVDLILIACQQRAKFEGWLKLELAAALQKLSDINDVILEGGYPGRGRADICFTYHGFACYLEMKTSNVNWRVKGVVNRTRPIKKNVDEIIGDIQKLRKNGASGIGLAVFAFFPIPQRIWLTERDKLNYHLSRIEQECSFAAGLILQKADFIEIDQQFGVCTFVLEVCRES